MEKEEKKASGDSDIVSNDDKGRTEDSVSYESHRKLLIEKKNLQARFQKLESELEGFKQSDLEAKGKQTELIESLRNQLSETKKESQEIRSKFAWNTLRSQIEREAINQGCINTNAFVKLMSKDDFNSIEVDDNFNVNSDDLKRIVEKNKADYKDIGLFKKEKVNVNDISTNETKAPPKPLTELSKDELIQLLKD